MTTDLQLRIGACKSLARDIQARAAAINDNDVFQLAYLLSAHLTKMADTAVDRQATTRTPDFLGAEKKGATSNVIPLPTRQPQPPLIVA